MKKEKKSIREKAQLELEQEPNYTFSILKTVAQQIPDMPLKTYIEIYAPDAVDNRCCSQCAFSVSGCSWSKNFTPVNGRIAVEGKSKVNFPLIFSTQPWYKIFYCPEFVKDSPAFKKKYCDKGLQELAEAMCKDAGEEYRLAIGSLKMYEKEIRTSRKGGKWIDKAAYSLAICGYVQAYDDLTYGRVGLLQNIYKKIDRQENFKLNRRLTNFCLKWQKTTKGKNNDKSD